MRITPEQAAKNIDFEAILAAFDAEQIAADDDESTEGYEGESDDAAELDYLDGCRWAVARLSEVR